jgi:hypothetical protein
MVFSPVHVVHYYPLRLALRSICIIITYQQTFVFITNEASPQRIQSASEFVYIIAQTRKTSAYAGIILVKQHYDKHASQHGDLSPIGNDQNKIPDQSPTQQIPHTHPTTAPPAVTIIPSFRHTHTSPLPAVAVQHQQRSRGLLVQLKLTPGSSSSGSLSGRSGRASRRLLKPIVRKLVARRLCDLSQVMSMYTRVHGLQSGASQTESRTRVLRYVTELGTKGGRGLVGVDVGAVGGLAS